MKFQFLGGFPPDQTRFVCCIPDLFVGFCISRKLQAFFHNPLFETLDITLL